MSDILLKLIELNKINNNLSSFQKSFNQNLKNVLNFDLINNLIIDSIKVCRSDSQINSFNHKFNEFKCFWPKCQFKSKK